MVCSLAISFSFMRVLDSGCKISGKRAARLSLLCQIVACLYQDANENAP